MTSQGQPASDRCRVILASRALHRSVTCRDGELDFRCGIASPFPWSNPCIPPRSRMERIGRKFGRLATTRPPPGQCEDVQAVYDIS